MSTGQMYAGCMSTGCMYAGCMSAGRILTGRTSAGCMFTGRTSTGRMSAGRTSTAISFFFKVSSQQLAQMRQLRNIVLSTAALIWCIVSHVYCLFSVYIVDEYLRNTLILIPSMIVNVFGLPFLFVCHISLFSKLLKGNIQGQFL